MQTRTLTIKVFSDDLAYSDVDGRALDHDEWPFNTRWTIFTPKGDRVTLRVNYDGGWQFVAVAAHDSSVAIADLPRAECASSH